MKKLMIVTLVAAAGLTVAACKTETVAPNATVTDIADTDAMNGTTNDTMAMNAVAGATNTVAGATNAVAATNAM